MRDPVAAFYAFCRVSDDAVDESAAPIEAHAALVARLDAIYRDHPDDHAVDRALAWLVRDHAFPRAPMDALLEGYLWDTTDRRYETLSDVRAYAARVAGAVGVAMTFLMGVRERDVLARAADLGVAMQLTNIARDVGEDAARGRVYLPSSWLSSEVADALSRGADRRVHPEILFAVRRLLDEADVLYRRSEHGIPALPADCRLAIRCARTVYAEIGEVVRARDGESLTSRAQTTTARKLALLSRAGRDELRARLSPLPTSSDPPLDETAFLLAR